MLVARSDSACRFAENGRMTIDAVVFDIGDVLEVNPPTGWAEQWARRVAMTLDEFEQALDAIGQLLKTSSARSRLCSTSTTLRSRS